MSQLKIKQAFLQTFCSFVKQKHTSETGKAGSQYNVGQRDVLGLPKQPLEILTPKT